MGLLDLLGFSRVPADVRGATLVVMNAADIEVAKPLLDALRNKLGALALATVGQTAVSAALPCIELPADLAKAAKLVTKIKPARLILLGLGGEFAALIPAAAAPAFWINAHDVEAAKGVDVKLLLADPALLNGLPNAIVTGDPLAGLESLPGIVQDEEMCVRFKEQHESDRWLGYFAGTGEDEEEEAYPIFNRLIRYKMGLMLLAPRDQDRCEPVYREAIKYKLQTIRHRRLSTSFVPVKTRVYFIEDPQPLEALYRCVDFVVAGGTLHANATNTPDIISPILHGKPVVVGPAHRNTPLVRSAAMARAVLAGHSAEEVFEHARMLLDNPKHREDLAKHARAWLEAQVGALQRVINAIG